MTALLPRSHSVGSSGAICGAARRRATSRRAGAASPTAPRCAPCRCNAHCHKRSENDPREMHGYAVNHKHLAVMTQRSSSPELFIQLASEQATSEPSLPPAGHYSEPIVSMPGAWQTHCSGCLAPAPETKPHESCQRSFAGSRCLMCPEWFACPTCSEKQAIAHQEAFPDEVHVMYTVDPGDEQFMINNEAASANITPWVFAFQTFVWPFFKMFMPSISVLLQVLMPFFCLLTTLLLMALLRCFCFC